MHLGMAQYPPDVPLTLSPPVQGSPDTAHATLGGAYLEAGRLDESIASNRAAMKLSPEYVARHAQIGDAFLLKGDYEAALSEYKSEPMESLRLAGLAFPTTPWDKFRQPMPHFPS